VGVGGWGGGGGADRGGGGGGGGGGETTTKINNYANTKMHFCIFNPDFLVLVRYSV